MKLVEKIKNANFNFVRKGRWFYIAPAVILAVGILMLAIFGFNLGLDFTGGTTVKINADGEYTKAEIEDKINNVLNKIRPYLENDGGNVEFVRYENGVAYVRLTGACSNCPLADHTLESGIESALINEIPEIIKVVNED